MILKAYEKADLQIEMFELEDVLTVSQVIHTTTNPPSTTAPTTLPGTTSGGVQSGSQGGATITIPFSDFIQ